jgi:hypothetical protein
LLRLLLAVLLQIAVLKEMDAKGPFVSLVMGVVVLKDVVVIVLFALNMELVPMVRRRQQQQGRKQRQQQQCSSTEQAAAALAAAMGTVCGQQVHCRIGGSRDASSVSPAVAAVHIISVSISGAHSSAAAAAEIGHSFLGVNDCC